MTTLYVEWGKSKVKLTWKESMTLPQHDLITSVHGFCFKNNEMLLVDLNKRGWDFPGGHIELNETPEECFKREALEEGSIEGDCELLGYIIVDHSENPMWKEDSPYPKMGYQVFYKMDITNVLPFGGEYESNQRIFIHPEAIATYYSKWNELYQVIVNKALESVNLSK